MEYAFLFTFPFFVSAFADYRKKIGNFKFYLMGWAFAFVSYLVVVFVDGMFRWGAFLIYMAAIATYISSDILINDYLFGKRKQEDEEKK